jgi:serine/threonine-protein kinase
VLVVFEGESSPARALSAATEILLLLSERESVFDEPEPPAVALTGGAMVCGSVVWGDRPGTVVAGVPVQQLEGLLREATAGVLYFTHEIYQQIGGLFQRVGVQVKAQKSVLGPKPLLVVTSEEAAKATGVTTARISSGTGEGRSLTDLVPGAVLGSRFDVLAELGAGPTGVVLKARDREMGDLVTLKMLRPEIVADAEHFEKLRGVIRTSRGIQHPNVLQVLDFGEADGMPYISMEFVRAMTLRQTLDQCRQIPVVAALRMSRQLAAGLLAGHNERLLHRGVKPQNVLVEPAGSIKVMDFGLTAPLRPGVVAEGLGYLAPEQLAGQVANDPRGDIYSWGAVVYEMLTGQLPYAGTTPVEISQRMTTQPAAPPSSVVPDLPPAFEAVILRAMERNVEGRFGSFVELVEALDGVRV